MGTRPYAKPIPKLWWLNQRQTVLYIVRELTSLFIAAYVVVVLLGLFRLSQGQAAYETYLAALQTPSAIVLHAVLLIFALFHTVTWFALTPKAMPIRIGVYRISGAVIVLAHYAVWIAASAALLLIARI